MKRNATLTAIAIIICVTANQRLSAEPVDTRSDTSDSDAKVVHIIDRLTFGPRPDDIRKVSEMGVQAFINEQLNPASIPEADVVKAIDASSETSRESDEDLLRIFAAYRSESSRIRSKREQLEIAAQKDAGKIESNAFEKGQSKPNDASDKQSPMSAPSSPAAKPSSTSVDTTPVADYFRRAQKQTILAKLVRAVEGPRQLEAVMTEFWFNHFNIYSGKDYDGILVGAYESEAIRPNVLGKFKDLLRATCYHPAMLYYLDNSQNKNTGSVNENYARELMELHTLGVDGGYKQKDVIELARILTGLTIATHMRTSGLAQVRGLERVGRNGAYFNNRVHDMGAKVLLGHAIVSSGRAEEIDQALDILAKHPSTAHHICYQLAQYFVADEPPPSLVEKLKTRFLNSDGDIKAILKDLFSSSEFWDPKYQNNKFKTPYRYSISILRAENAHVKRTDFLTNFLSQQGQKLYGCLTPDGYKNTKQAWLDPDALLHCLDFAVIVGSGKVPGMEIKPQDYKDLEATVGANNLSQNTLAIVDKAPKNLKAAAVLGSPELMRF
jgi:uncharacterized protein (DUF1800 family)